MRQDASGLIFLLPTIILVVIGAFGYLKLISTMFQKKNCQNIISEQMNTKIVLYFCTIMTALTFVFADYISKLAIYASFGI